MVKKTKTNKPNKTFTKTNKNDTQTEHRKRVQPNKISDLQIDKYSTVSNWLGRKRKSSRLALINKNRLKGDPPKCMFKTSEENFEALKDPRVRPSAIMRKQMLENTTLGLRRGYRNMCCHYPERTSKRHVPHFFWKNENDERLYPDLYFSKGCNEYLDKNSSSRESPVFPDRCQSSQRQKSSSDSDSSFCPSHRSPKKPIASPRMVLHWDERYFKHYELPRCHCDCSLSQSMPGSEILEDTFEHLNANIRGCGCCEDDHPHVESTKRFPYKRQPLVKDEFKGDPKVIK